jgi:hypothetical protein
MPAPLPIRTDRDAAELRRLARREHDGRVPSRATTSTTRAAGNPRWPLPCWSMCCATETETKYASGEERGVGSLTALIGVRPYGVAVSLR